ncbi:hypothetical protein DNTS_016268 [Danionella cerebrum]|uniref:Uncharacterized protein n=1 Tax=Danionella cerebrum TaxID=2873325 RepID=A0A553Q0V4_9TELE|nr:hypothetical protein DNTS_016268 [Danionella translucida]
MSASLLFNEFCLIIIQGQKQCEEDNEQLMVVMKLKHIPVYHSSGLQLWIHTTTEHVCGSTQIPPSHGLAQHCGVLCCQDFSLQCWSECVQMEGFARGWIHEGWRSKTAVCSLEDTYAFTGFITHSLSGVSEECEVRLSQAGATVRTRDSEEMDFSEYCV